MPRLRRASSAVTVKRVNAAPDVAASFYKRDLNHLSGMPYIIIYWLDREILEISLDSPPQVTFDLLGPASPASTLATIWHQPRHPAWTQDGHGNGYLRPSFA